MILKLPGSEHSPSNTECQVLPPGISNSVELGGSQRIGISNRLPGDASASDLGLRSENHCSGLTLTFYR